LGVEVPIALNGDGLGVGLADDLDALAADERDVLGNDQASNGFRRMQDRAARREMNDSCVGINPVHRMFRASSLVCTDDVYGKLTFTQQSYTVDAMRATADCGEWSKGQGERRHAEAEDAGLEGAHGLSSRPGMHLQMAGTTTPRSHAKASSRPSPSATVDSRESREQKVLEGRADEVDEELQYTEVDIGVQGVGEISGREVREGNGTSGVDGVRRRAEEMVDVKKKGGWNGDFVRVGEMDAAVTPRHCVAARRGLSRVRWWGMTSVYQDVSVHPQLVNADVPILARRLHIDGRPPSRFVVAAPVYRCWVCPSPHPVHAWTAYSPFLPIERGSTVRLLDANSAVSVDGPGPANSATPFLWDLRVGDPEAGRITPAREWLGRVAGRKLKDIAILRLRAPAVSRKDDTSGLTSKTGIESKPLPMTFQLDLKRRMCCLGTRWKSEGEMDVAVLRPRALAVLLNVKRRIASESGVGEDQAGNRGQRPDLLLAEGDEDGGRVARGSRETRKRAS
ncbi:hypothetical protein POSPLADRAFT_1152393, partial [Postia placenta MAD-698-R-SB12]